MKDERERHSEIEGSEKRKERGERERERNSYSEVVPFKCHYIANEDESEKWEDE